MNVSRTPVALGLCLALVGAATAHGQDAAKTHPDLSGEWVLNRELSADPRESAEGRRGREGRDPEGRGRRGGGMPGGFGGGPPGGGFPGGGFGPGAGDDERQMREQMDQAQQLLRDVPTSMVMTYTDPKLAIVARDGRIRTLYADKRKVKTANGNAETQARWDGGRLIVETRFGSIKVVEGYALAENGDQLIVTARMDAPGAGRGDGPKPPELRRVYDRVSEDRPGSAREPQ
jgi:hypothetical protein